MKTAVEWLIEKLDINGVVIPMQIEYLAKEMEDEQRRKDYIKGRKDGIRTMKIISLYPYDDVFQVVSEDESSVYYQGSLQECENYIQAKQILSNQ
jgi:hypothetical protein